MLVKDIITNISMDSSILDILNTRLADIPDKHLKQWKLSKRLGKKAGYAIKRLLCQKSI